MGCTQECTQGAGRQLGGGVGLALGALGVPTCWWGDPRVVPTEVCEWTSCSSPEADMRKCISLMTFDILICLLSFLFAPSSHGGPTSEIWVLQERNGLLWNLHYCGNPAFSHHFCFSLPPWERSPLPTSSSIEVATARVRSPVPCSVTLERGPTLVNFSLSSASKVIFIPLWWHAEIFPLVDWTAINSLPHGYLLSFALSRLFLPPSWWMTMVQVLQIPWICSPCWGSLCLVGGA